MHHRVAAELQWPDANRCRERRSQTTGAECATAASKSGSVGIGLAGASIQTRSAAAGGAPVWSYSTYRTPHGSSCWKSAAVPWYGTLRDAIVARTQHRQHDRGGGRCPRGEEQRVTAVEGVRAPPRPRVRSGSSAQPYEKVAARRSRPASWPERSAARSRSDSSRVLQTPFRPRRGVSARSPCTHVRVVRLGSSCGEEAGGPGVALTGQVSAGRRRGAIEALHGIVLGHWPGPSTLPSTPPPL